MQVQYGHVSGCTYEMRGGKPLLTAPETGFSAKELIDAGFVQDESGRFVHLLSRQEFLLVMQGYPDSDGIISEQDITDADPEPAAKAPADLIAAAAAVCAGLSILLRIAGIHFNLLELGAIVLIILLRVRYPKHRIGRMLWISMLCIFAGVFLYGLNYVRKILWF